MPTAHPDLDATRRHWDQQAGTYDAAKRRNDAYYSTLKGCIADAVPMDFRGRVLDVGCGTGQILASLRPRAGLGIDLSERMIANARAAFSDRPELQFHVMPARELADPVRGQFDSVISADMLEHADDWQAAVTAMVGACRAGGLIVISTPNPGWTFPLWLLEKARMKMPEGPHRFVSAREVAEHLTGLGCINMTRRTHLLVPARLGGFGPGLSRLAARLPLLDRLGVIQIITGRRPPA
jgi:2-polyprenyl-3-methyl-5-hydroxy-6-metoxy-1,4-benzoquinol methylase